MLWLSKHVDTKHETLLTTTKVKCENCSETFQTDELLTKHNEENQFVCDDCFMCLTTQFHADLHELDKHPDSVYAATFRTQPSNCSWKPMDKFYLTNVFNPVIIMVWMTEIIFKGIINRTSGGWAVPSSDKLK